MDDARGLTSGYRDQLQQATVLVGSDHEETVLAAVLIFDEPDGIGPSVLDVGSVDPVFQGGSHNLHMSRVT